MSEAEAETDRGREIWIEKYRPQTLDDIVGHEAITERMKQYINQKDLPHLLLAGPAGTGKCVTGDTPVLTNSGVKRIDSVVGDAEGLVDADGDLEIATFSENGGFEFTSPSHIFSKEANDLVRISTRDGGESTVTPEHRFLTIGRGGLSWTQADDLKPGLRVVRPHEAPLPESNGTIDWMDALDGDRVFVHVTEEFAALHDISVTEDYVGKKKEVFEGIRADESDDEIARRVDTAKKTVQSYRRQATPLDLDGTSTVCSLSHLRSLDATRDSLREHVLAIQYVSPYNRRSRPIEPPWELTPKLAAFMGLSLSEARVESARIKFYNNSEELLEQFSGAARDSFGIEPKQGEQKGVEYRSINNRTVVHYLRRCFAVFAESSVIGSSLVCAPTEARRAFLRAVFDAEGHVQEKGILELTQKDGDVITLLSYLLAGEGVPTRRKTKHKAATNGSGTKRPYHVLFLSGAATLSRFEERIGFTLSTKAERLSKNAERAGDPNHDTIPVQSAVDDLCEALYLPKGELLTDTLNPETPGRENYLADVDRTLEAATERIETAQEVLEAITRLETDIERSEALPARWTAERERLEPISVRRELEDETGVRSDRLLEYSDGRRTPERQRVTTLLREVNVLETTPDITTLQTELRAAIERLGVPYNHVANGTDLLGTDIINLLDNDDHALTTTIRFRTVAERVREIAAGMLSQEVLEGIRRLDTLARGDLYFDEVESVERISESCRVYDLTVPETRNYVAGIVPTVMHNTTSAVAIAKEIYGDDWRENFLELNASDQRGIDVVRDRIKSFARASFGGYDHRVIFLDEADALCLPPGTPVVTGPPSSPEVTPIEDVSRDGESITSVDFETNEIQSDSGRLLRTGTADFYRVELHDGRSVVASPRHPFFVVNEDGRLEERELQELDPDDEIADYREPLGLSRCDACGEWTGNSRFCCQACKDDGHATEMSDSENPMYGREAWNRGLTKDDDERVTAQANPGAENGNYGGKYHGPNPWDDPEIAADLKQKLSAAMSGRSLGEEHRRKIGLGVREHHSDKELSMDAYQPHYRRVVPDRDDAECEVCGERKPTSGRDGIYVHHIDGDRKNNSSDNLMLVCPRCHNFAVHDRRKGIEDGWKENPSRTDVTDGGRAIVDTVPIKAIEFDHHGPAYNITMDGTPNFALGNGILTHNTSDAQSALRRTMEQFSDNTRFILSCNYSSQIIDPIQSRCAVFRFSPLGDDAVAEQTRIIADAEGIEITDDGMDALVYAADGDMRKAINGLQAAAVMGEVVDEDAVYTITSTARPEEIQEMATTALDGDFTAARAQLDSLLTDVGIAGGDIIDQMHRSVWEFDLDDEQAVQLMERIGEADYRITAGANEQIQLEALLASLALNAE